MSGGWDGRPEDTEREGWHWLRRDDDSAQDAPWLWQENFWCHGNEVFTPCDMAGMGWRYLGPALPPADVAAAVMAEREACAAICGEVARERWAAEKKRPIGALLFLWLGGPDSECKRRIQQRPAPSAPAGETKP